jgi:cytidylate kinase
MKKTVITVSRQFGSGGRTVARLVAEKLGYRFFERALVERVAKESGYGEDFVEQHGEDASSTSSFLFNLARSGAGGQAGVPGISDKLYVTEHNVIRQIADEGPCVIVGHCADYILADRSDALHIFIHANKQFKADRIVRLYGECEDTPNKRLEAKDKKRSVYYKNYTGRVWGAAENYHICLDSGALGVEKCAEIITRLVEDD